MRKSENMPVGTSLHNVEDRGLALCICTYQRPHLLRLLLDDVLKQTLQPNVIVVVDGDPAGEVRAILRRFAGETQSEAIYIVSNHPNLAYQRYLGWASIRDRRLKVLLYLDDDLRLMGPDAIERVVKPLERNGGKVAGVTADVTIGDVSRLAGERILVEQAQVKTPCIVKWFGSARHAEPGGLSPSGHRRVLKYRGKESEKVQWLWGRVMAYSLAALTGDCFSDDLFALTHLNCGLGEDTFLSRRVGAKGDLLLVFGAGFAHPHADLPKSYPIEAFRFGYATAYSRRLLNDYYRAFDAPRLSDRMALVKSYLGTSLLNWLRALRILRRYRLAYAWGYTLGAIRGLIQKPTARNLTPEIDWWADAQECLANAQVLHAELAVK